MVQPAAVRVAPGDGPRVRLGPQLTITPMPGRPRVDRRRRDRSTSACMLRRPAAQESADGLWRSSRYGAQWSARARKAPSLPGAKMVRAGLSGTDPGLPSPARRPTRGRRSRRRGPDLAPPVSRVRPPMKGHSDFRAAPTAAGEAYGGQSPTRRRAPSPARAPGDFHSGAERAKGR